MSISYVISCKTKHAKIRLRMHDSMIWHELYLFTCLGHFVKFLCFRSEKIQNLMRENLVKITH